MSHNSGGIENENENKDMNMDKNIYKDNDMMDINDESEHENEGGGGEEGEGFYNVVVNNESSMYDYQQHQQYENPYQHQHNPYQYKPIAATLTSSSIFSSDQNHTQSPSPAHSSTPSLTIDTTSHPNITNPTKSTTTPPPPPPPPPHDSLSTLISSLSTENSPISPFPSHAPQHNHTTTPTTPKEPLRLQIPSTSSTSWDQLPSPFDLAPFPSPLIGPVDSDDYDSMALFRAFNGRSSPMSAAVSRASSLRRPTSLSPQDKKTPAIATSPSASSISPATIAAATAALTSLKRHNLILADVTGNNSNIPSSSSTINTSPLLPAIIPITKEKRTVSEYIPITNNANNNILPPRIPGILVEKRSDEQIYIPKRETDDSPNRIRSNSEIKNPLPYRPPYGRSSSSEHVNLIEKLHRERIPSGRASPLAKPATITTTPHSKVITNNTSTTASTTTATTITTESESKTQPPPPPTTTTTTTTTPASTTAGTIALSTDKPGRIYEAYDTKKRRSTWREVSLLGRGAFSRVVLAKPVERFVTPKYRNKIDSTLVAIKIVELGAAGGASRDRIESGLSREIDILKTVYHPSIIPLYGFNMDKTKALMVLSYCKGGDLFDLASKYRDKLRPQLIRRIFSEVVHAVAYLHENNIVHRDIKLENVLLNLSVEELLKLEDIKEYKYPITTLTDLGLSRKIDPENPNLITRCGSEDYVPPELLMGQPYDGRQTDSWALGVLLYAVMEGRLPFDPPKNVGGGRARGRTAHRIARVEWSWIAFLNNPPDEWLGGMRIVEGCLQKRDLRLKAVDIVNMPWVKDAMVENLQPNSSLPISDIFIEGD